MNTIVVVLVIVVLLLVAGHIQQNKQIIDLQSNELFALMQLRVLCDPGNSRRLWEAHRSNHELEQRMHQLVLKARATGNLDHANKIMELQHWAECDYDAGWIYGMFRGFP